MSQHTENNTLLQPPNFNQNIIFETNHILPGLSPTLSATSNSTLGSPEINSYQNQNQNQNHSHSHNHNLRPKLHSQFFQSFPKPQQSQESQQFQPSPESQQSQQCHPILSQISSLTTPTNVNVNKTLSNVQPSLPILNMPPWLGLTLKPLSADDPASRFGQYEVIPLKPSESQIKIKCPFEGCKKTFVHKGKALQKHTTAHELGKITRRGRKN